MKRTALVAVLLLVAGCGAGGEASSTTSLPGDDPFQLAIEPSQFSPVAPGQLCVIVATASGGDAPVGLRAVLTGQATVDPPEVDLVPGEVVEFTVIPEPGSAGSTLSLELRGVRGAYEESHTLTMEVVDWPDELEPFASELRDRFVTYIEAEQTELGITTGTVWTPTITKPQILVVSHYLFFSDEWEMGIMWHVTVPEHAWARMYLRPRNELVPTIGLEIPSYPDPASTPVPWEPPAEIDR